MKILSLFTHHMMLFFSVGSYHMTSEDYCTFNGGFWGKFDRHGHFELLCVFHREKQQHMGLIGNDMNVSKYWQDLHLSEVFISSKPKEILTKSVSFVLKKRKKKVLKVLLLQDDCQNVVKLIAEE